MTNGTAVQTSLREVDDLRLAKRIRRLDGNEAGFVVLGFSIATRTGVRRPPRPALPVLLALMYASSTSIS